MGGRSTSPPNEATPPRGRDACKALRLETILMSPQVPALASVKVGNVLTVALQGAQQHRFVAVLNASGAPIGTVGSDRTIQLIDCLDRGYVYVAEVVALDGAACRVLIRH